MNIRIVTDSTCDLPEEIVSQHAISVIPLAINVGDKSFLDGVDLTRSEFYAQLPNFNPHPKTAAPGPEVFTQVFERLANEGGQAILSIHISETLSATVNSARIAAEQFTRIPVTVLDSSQLSLGLGFIVERAAQLAESGKETQEIISTLKNLMKRTYVFASLKTLEYLRRSGRMNFALARFGESVTTQAFASHEHGQSHRSPHAHAKTRHRPLARMAGGVCALRKTSHPARGRSGRSRSLVSASAFLFSAKRSSYHANHPCPRRASRHRRNWFCLHLKGINS